MSLTSQDGLGKIEQSLGWDSENVGGDAMEIDEEPVERKKSITMTHLTKAQSQRMLDAQFSKLDSVHSSARHLDIGNSSFSDSMNSSTASFVSFGDEDEKGECGQVSKEFKQLQDHRPTASAMLMKQQSYRMPRSSSYRRGSLSLIVESKFD